MTGTQVGLVRTEPDIEAERMEMIGRLCAGLAHDLNGPLGVVLGFVQLAREKLEGGKDEDSARAAVSEYLKMIEHAGQNARALAKDMWDFARTRPGATGQFDLEEALARASRLVAPTLRVAGIEPPESRGEMEGGGERAPGPLVDGDAALWTHAFVALLLQAPEVLPAGGAVEWSVEYGCGDARVTLRAVPGEPLPGNNEEKCQTLCEWRWTRTTVDIVDNQGGKIGSSLDPENAGATLELSLPTSPRA